MRQSRQQLKGAFPGCTWCGGWGCTMCDQARRKAEEDALKPILSFTPEDLRDPEKARLIRDVVGVEAVEKAFGPDGGGIGEIEQNCTLASLVLLLKKQHEKRETGGSKPQITEP